MLGISGGADLKMTEINDAAKLVRQTVDPSARIIFGAYHDRKLKPNQIKVTVIATGFSGSGQGNSLFGGGFASPRTYLGEDRPLKTVLSDEERSEFGEPHKKGKKEAMEVPAENVKYTPAVKPGIFGPKDDFEDKEEETSPWDIPTFLRKRKK